MRRTYGLIAVVVLLLAAWVEVSWYIGKRIEGASRNRLDAINTRLNEDYPGLGLSVRPISYERGFLSTKARYALQLDRENPWLAGMPASNTALTLLAWDVNITHGPFAGKPLGGTDNNDGAPSPAAANGLLAGRMHLALAKTDTTQGLFALTQDAPLFEADATLDYLGDTHFWWRLRPLQATLGETAIAFSGAQGSGRIDAGDALHMHASAGNLMLQAVHGDHDQGQAQGIVLDIDNRPVKSGIPAGTMSLDVAKLDLSVPAIPARISVQGLHFGTAIEEKDRERNVVADARIAALRFNDKDAGNGQIRIRLDRLDGMSAIDMLRAMQRLSSVNVLGSGLPSVVYTARATIDRATTSILSLRPGITVEYTFWKTPRGEARLEGSVELGLTPRRDSGNSVWTGLDAIRQLRLQASISRPAIADLVQASWPLIDPNAKPAKVEQNTNDVIAAARRTGLFDYKDMTLSSRIDLADGMADVNGKRDYALRLFTHFFGERPPPDGRRLMNPSSPEVLIPIPIPMPGSIPQDTDMAAEDGAQAAGQALNDAIVPAAPPIVMPPSAFPAPSSPRKAKPGAPPKRGFVKQDMERLLAQAGWSSAWIDMNGDPPTQDIAVDASRPIESIAVTYPGCHGAICANMNLKATFDIEKPVDKKNIDYWNQHFHLGRGYLADRKPVLELDLSAGDNISESDIVAQVRDFIGQTLVFQVFLQQDRYSVPGNARPSGQADIPGRAPARAW